MKTIISIILILLLCAMPMSACSKETEVKIKIMSFNIRTLTLEDNPINNWENRKEDVLSTILKYDADLIGFQELKQSQYNFLQQNLTAYNFYGVDRIGPNLSESVAIFYKKDRFELLSYKTFWLSETPDVVSMGWDAGVQRTCTVMKFKDIISGEVITHINTHFDNRGEIARANSADMILDEVSKTEGAFVVTGDFNLSEGSEVYNHLTETLDDTKYLAPEGMSDSGGTTQSFGLSSPTLPIDYVFINKDYFDTLSYSIIRDTDGEGNYPSDHFPLIVELQYK